MQPAPRTSVWILIGPKGAGKTFIGALLERERGIPFLRVEPVFLEVIEREGRKDDEVFGLGFSEVADRIDRRLIGADTTTDTLVIESTAAWHRFGEFLDRLRTHHRVRMVRVETPPDQCIDRVRTRDAAAHIPVSDPDVRLINEAATAVDFPVEGTIENANGTTEADLLRQWDAIGR
jgi:hypothetical protein